MLNGLCIECFSFFFLRLYIDSCKAPVRVELTTPGLLDQCSNRWAMEPFLPCFSMVAAKFLHKHSVCKARRPEHSSCYLNCVISVIKSLSFVNRFIVNTLRCLVSIFRAKNMIDSLATSVLVYVQWLMHWKFFHSIFEVILSFLKGPSESWTRDPWFTRPVL